jgi:hypothetical protein
MNIASLIETMRDKFIGMSRAYRDTFDGPQGERVLADLYPICCMGESTYKGNDTQMKINEGKRQVFLHIMAMCRADEAELARLAHDQALEIYRQSEDFQGAQ